jgi:Zn-dependent hydrolases, including glyoxylases
MFISRKLNFNTWVISGEGCDCYLLEGTNEAIVIDAGESTENIRVYAQTLTELPLSKVINTHAHFDHTGGNGHFETVFATKGVARSAKNTMGAPRENYPLDYKFTYVNDGDVIPIEGRPLTVITLDCHSPEDIALLDTENRMLFSGDEVESGQVLLLPGYAEEPGQIHAKPAASVETCLEAMLRLKAEEAYFDMIYPAHNGTPIDKSYLDRFIYLCRGIMSGSIIGDTDCSSSSYNASATHFPNPEACYRRAVHDGAVIIYCERLIFDKDYETADTLPAATPLHVISSEFACKP